MEWFGLNEFEIAMNLVTFAFGGVMGKLIAQNQRLKKELENEN